MPCWTSVARFEAWDDERLRGTPIMLPCQASLLSLRFHEDGGRLSLVAFEYGGLRYATTPDRFATAIGIASRLGPCQHSSMSLKRCLGITLAAWRVFFGGMMSMLTDAGSRALEFPFVRAGQSTGRVNQVRLLCR